MSSEEKTPTQSRHNSPSPTRSPVTEPKEYDPIVPPNSPKRGIPEHWSQRAQDNITMGFGFAQSWMNTIKPSRNTVEERIRLPQIYHVPRKEFVCLVALTSVDEALFHTILMFP